MPSLSEHQILLGVLAAVFASLPVAMVVRRLLPRRQEHPRIEGGSAPGGPVAVPPPLPPPPPVFAAESPYAPPLTEMPLPPPVAYPLHRSWAKRDAWFAIILAMVVALLMGPIASGGTQHLGGAGESAVPWTGLFVVQIIFQAGFVALILGYLCLYRRFKLTGLFGLRTMSPLKTIGVAIACIVASFVVVSFIAAFTVPFLQEVTGIELKRQMLVESANQISDPTARILMFITLCVGAPLLEELIFRGVLFSVAARYFHPVYAIVATSLFFAVIHDNLFSLIPLAALGMALATAYHVTRSLAVPVIMHAIFNCLQFLVLMYGPKDLQ